MREEITSQRIAVIGCGSIGRRHARNLKAMGCRSVIAYDPWPESRRKLCDEAGIAALDELEAVWNHEPSIAVIAMPTCEHVPMAIEAALRGCHLLIEKPLSHSLEGIDELRNVVETSGLVASVACNMRFHPGPALLKQTIEEREIGAILSARIETGSYLPNWRPGTDYRSSYSASRERGGGVVLDCIHEIDIAQWFFGSGELVATSVRPAHSIGLTVEGLAEMIVLHESRTLSSIHLNFVQRDYHRAYRVIGDGGSAYWDFSTGTTTIDLPSGRRVTTQPAGWTVNQMYIDQLVHFLACVEANEPAPNGIPEATRTLGLALAARG